MRFYELNLYEPGASKPARTWTTHPNGVWDPGALLCEFDIIVTPYATPAGASTVTLMGVAMQDLMQTQQFGMHYDNTGKLQSGMRLELKGGMAKGLPLASPAQAGILIDGLVYLCFGNWQRTDMRLDFVVTASPYTSKNQGNFVLDWRRGQKLSHALNQCLSVAYPGHTIRIAISDQVVADQDMVHVCGTLEELSRAVKESTEGNYVNADYPGVDIAIQGGIVRAYDGTAGQAVVQLNFTDLVGQPTWVGFNTLSVITVMRGDVLIGDVVALPAGMINAPGAVSMTQQAMSSMLNMQLTFQGKFLVTKMRHIGNSRAPDGALWVTAMECVPYVASNS